MSRARGCNWPNTEENVIVTSWEISCRHNWYFGVPRLNISEVSLRGLGMRTPVLLYGLSISKFHLQTPLLSSESGLLGFPGDVLPSRRRARKINSGPLSTPASPSGIPLLSPNGQRLEWRDQFYQQRLNQTLAKPPWSLKFQLNQTFWQQEWRKLGNTW